MKFSSDCARLGSFEIGLDRRRGIFLPSVHTAVENGRHQLRVQRDGRRKLRGFRAHILVHFFQLDNIRIVHRQRR